MAGLMSRIIKYTCLLFFSLFLLISCQKSANISGESISGDQNYGVNNPSIHLNKMEQCLSSISISPSNPIEHQMSRPLILVHYMPWFQAGHGQWGWHWTMNTCDPEKTLDGKREIASHYYPLIGPYDSQDSRVVEYHALLMVLSGIDGVIVDWSGSTDYYDYAFINGATHQIFSAMKKTGLTFAVMYEDQTIRNMLKNSLIDYSEIHKIGSQDMQYLGDWFGDENYLHIHGRPILFDFGPQFFTKASDWNKLLSGMENVPILISEDTIRPAGVAGACFPWPPMSQTKTKTLSRAQLNSYLTSFYRKTRADSIRIAGAFPGFNDFYEEGKEGKGYPILNSEDGETFRFTLNKAIDSKPDVIQIVTWNDFGEGTNIEPAYPYEYQYLEIIQEFRRKSNGGFVFDPEDLQLAKKVYDLRGLNDSVINGILDKVTESIRQGDAASARSLLSCLENR